MLMMLVMHMWMRMLHHLMLMFVAVHLGDMEQDASAHH
jgi:hypothetical protein